MAAANAVVMSEPERWERLRRYSRDENVLASVIAAGERATELFARTRDLWFRDGNYWVLNCPGMAPIVVTDQIIGEGNQKKVRLALSSAPPFQPLAVSFSGFLRPDIRVLFECERGAERLLLERKVDGVARSFFSAVTYDLVKQPYIGIAVNPFYECGDLFAFIQSEEWRQLSNRHRVALCLQVANVVAALDQHQLSHGDIKVENVFITRERGDLRAYLGDLSTVAWAGHPHLRNFFGTVYALAPERVLLGMGQTRASDAWSLGILFYVALTGRSVFWFSSSIEETRDSMSSPGFTVELNRTLCDLGCVYGLGIVFELRKLLNFDPEQRGTAAQFVEALGKIIDHLPEPLHVTEESELQEWDVGPSILAECGS